MALSEQEIQNVFVSHDAVCLIIGLAIQLCMIMYEAFPARFHEDEPGLRPIINS